MTLPRRALPTALAALALTAGVLGPSGCSGSGSGSGPGEQVAVDTSATFPPGSTMDRIRQAGKIRIGVSFDQPGIGYRDSSSEDPTGFDIEMGKIIAGRLGLKTDQITWVDTGKGERETYLRNRSVDLVLATFSITPERRRVIGMAGPYYQTGQQLLVRAGSAEISGTAQIKGKRVCAAAGTTSMQRIKKRFQVTVVPETTTSGCVAKLRNGAVDAVTGDGAALLGYAAQTPGKLEVVGKPFSTERYGVGYAKGDTELCGFLNDTLEHAFRKGGWDRALFATLWKSNRSVPDYPTLDPCR